MSKAKDRYYNSIQTCDYINIIANTYIKELEQQNEEMLDFLIRRVESLKYFGYNMVNSCVRYDYKEECYEEIEFIEKITGKSIDEVIK